MIPDEWLQPGAVVEVNMETTHRLLEEIKYLRTALKRLEHENKFLEELNVRIMQNRGTQ